VVRVYDGKIGSCLRAGVEGAVDFVCTNGLPAVGACLAGPLGLAGGLVASAALGKLKLEKMALGQMALGVAALYAPSTALVGLAVGATLAATLEGSARWQRPGFEVDGKAFRSHLREQLKQDGLSPGWASSLRSLVSVAEETKGADYVLATAAEVVKNNYPADRIDQGIDLRPLQSRIVESEKVGEVQVHRVRNLRQIEKTDGYAVFRTVFLDESHQLKDSLAKTDLTLGHEASHARHQDSAASLGENLVLRCLPPGPLLDRMNTALQQLSYRRELRADQEGYQFALQRGHSVDSILEAATEVFGSSGPTAEHPAAKDRLAALAQATPPARP
jgi:hypothetical protein